MKYALIINIVWTLSTDHGPVEMRWAETWPAMTETECNIYRAVRQYQNDQMIAAGNGRKKEWQYSCRPVN